MYLPLSFISTMALAASALAHSAHHVNRHSKREAQKLKKRFDNARWTFYDVGEDACGSQSAGSDFVVALNSEQYGGGYPGPQCFKTITMNYNDKTTQATIVDECPTCSFGELDLSRGLFDFFGSEDEGIIYGTWSFDEDGEGGEEPTTYTFTSSGPEPTEGEGNGGDNGSNVSPGDWIPQ